MSCATPAKGFDFASAHAAIEHLLSRLSTVSGETVDLQDAAGRVLSQPVLADRDSPPSDVSAMDGYAVRADQAKPGKTIDILAEIAIGQPAPVMPASGCFKIGTGACVPSECDGIIPREQVVESPQSIRLHNEIIFKTGQHIRRKGENTRASEQIACVGTPITPPVASALAAFGVHRVQVYRQVRVTILTTGDELQPVDSTPKPWQIRDSNSATLRSALTNKPWIELVQTAHAIDDQTTVSQALQTAAEHADLIITTGGVSMGDHDYLRPALLQAGGEVVYHKLPIRPGKPSLGGLLTPRDMKAQTVPVVALPGNPVAVAVGVPLFISPVSRKLAGIRQYMPIRPNVQINNPPKKTLPLWRYLPACWAEDGQVQLLETKGSGDLAAAAQADGYVQIPPDGQGNGPWVFYDATR